jgi:replicative DNA helicase
MGCGRRPEEAKTVALMGLEDVLGRLRDYGLKKIGPERWEAKCCAHEDHTPSLGIKLSDDRSKILAICRAGCPFKDVVSGLGLVEADFFMDQKSKTAEETLPPDKWPLIATYLYENRAGDPLYRVQRRCSADSGRKTFRQHRADGKGGWIPNMDGAELVLYRLPQVTESSEMIFVVEGEKDADALAALGLVATTNVGGAGKWRAEYGDALRGRDVVILPDNDEPGDKHAALVLRSLSGIAARVAVLKLDGLPTKGDVSDWLASGGKREDLERLARAALEHHQAFRPSVDRIQGETSERVTMSGETLTFGVRYLDDALGGIVKRDLILVGARTGAGKTQLATIAALANCRKGRRVHYFALEAEDREIERRIKYQIVAREYYHRLNHGKRIRYLDWYQGRLEDELGQYSDLAEAEMRDSVAKNLHTYYRVDSFTSEDFAAQLAKIATDTDLVILDHLHYVDHAEDENENKGYKRIVKQIRDSALRLGKPVIVVAHVRKADRKFTGLVPDVEDFHGSSDIGKIATKAVTLAPDFTTIHEDPSLWSTFIHVAKCRQDNAVTRYVAKCNFNTRTDSYQDLYSLGRLVDNGREYRALSEKETPAWAIKS